MAILGARSDLRLVKEREEKGNVWAHELGLHTHMVTNQTEEVLHQVLLVLVPLLIHVSDKDWV